MYEVLNRSSLKGGRANRSGNYCNVLKNLHKSCLKKITINYCETDFFIKVLSDIKKLKRAAL